MIYSETNLAGAFVIDIAPIKDERGFFSYLFDVHEAASHGLRIGLAQVKLSFNNHKGTLRGMHWQAAPAAEIKLIRCTRGAIRPWGRRS